MTVACRDKKFHERGRELGREEAEEEEEEEGGSCSPFQFASTCVCASVCLHIMANTHIATSQAPGRIETPDDAGVDPGCTRELGFAKKQNETQNGRFPSWHKPKSVDYTTPSPSCESGSGGHSRSRSRHRRSRVAVIVVVVLL